jgi:hypothetical protein
MHPFDLEGVLPAAHHIVIEFIPAGKISVDSSFGWAVLLVP